MKKCVISTRMLKHIHRALSYTVSLIHPPIKMSLMVTSQRLEPADCQQLSCGYRCIMSLHVYTIYRIITMHYFTIYRIVIMHYLQLKEMHINNAINCKVMHCNDAINCINV